ncbi:hypothetical protein [Nostoc sp. UHCC 0251]|uniref:hypothetical protein n=1 Tax=Nostoc sp. UHCC 0251 TaxID=3110240 RepID=UPI002B1FA0A4|nr:hypothetical protein [Nostoc sp. UHCC 0251]MEA5628355.1 hypothetical protein [Nostoc sp. UHCC 0251]
MVIKILELGLLMKLTEEEEESYKGGTPTEIKDPASGVSNGVESTKPSPPITLGISPGIITPDILRAGVEKPSVVKPGVVKPIVGTIPETT